ncbi:hypothetical protein R1flu_020891 [Riccia fluitans]|uniref:Uncharacterized protein n=1 Tax=Riccia fluitans TaxID=41844 RepID=A0ABD1ZMT3_9MARC
MLRSGQYMAGFRWLTTAKISRLRAKRIWRACTTPQSVEVKDVDNILFGIDTPTRYFQDNEDRKHEANETAEEKNGPADDDRMSNIPIVDLDRNTDCGADLHRVRDALLYTGFGVVMQTNKKDVKQERAMEDLSDYCQLWD